MSVEILVRAAAASMLNSLLAGAVITIVAWTLARWLRLYDAGLRFAIWLVALLAIPFLVGGGSSALASYRVGTSPAQSAGTLPVSVAWYLFGFWVLGAGYGLARVVYGLVRLKRQRAACVAMSPDQLDARVRSALNENRSHRSVQMCVSKSVRVPAAIGYFRPMVVFPAWTLEEMSPDQLRAILLHELAHLRRYDDWTNLAQKVVKAVFFFHPAVWFIESRLTLEREIACDDVVLAADFSPRTYAESLVSLAEKSFLRRGVALAQAAVGQVQQLKLRLVQIMQSDRQTGRRPGKVFRVALALAGSLVLLAIAWSPQLVEFDAGRDDTPAMAAQRIVSSPKEKQTVPAVVNASFYTESAHRHVGSRTGQRANRSSAGNGGRATYQTKDVVAVQPFGTTVPGLVHLTDLVGFCPVPLVPVVQGKTDSGGGLVVWTLTVIHIAPAQQFVVHGIVPRQI